LEQLTQAGKVFDKTEPNPGKIDTECFSSILDPFRTGLIKIIHRYLLEGEESTKKIKFQPHKLNIYCRHLIFIRPYPILYCCPGKGSSFKPHVDPPRSKKMVGSLVIVFPTHHEGGALFLRHRGHEWIFDSGQALAALDRPSIGYVAFLNDIEQDVAPVTSGHRVTLTYNLYFDDDGGPVSWKDAVSEHFTPPKPPNQNGFSEAFTALLENSEFMAEGGMLAFGLRHGYLIEHRGLGHIYDFLKGSDTVVYQSVRALGFEPVLHMYYDEGFSPPEGVIVDVAVGFCAVFEEYSVSEIAQAEGGILVRQDSGSIYEDPHGGPTESIEWVTPMTTYSRKEDAFVSRYDTTQMNWAYGDLCMVVRIGKAGDRLAYPTVAQVKKAYEQSGYRREID
jgi:hypothetical protein